MTRSSCPIVTYAIVRNGPVGLCGVNARKRVVREHTFVIVSVPLVNQGQIVLEILTKNKSVLKSPVLSGANGTSGQSVTKTAAQGLSLDVAAAEMDEIVQVKIRKEFHVTPESVRNGQSGPIGPAVVKHVEVVNHINFENVYMVSIALVTRKLVENVEKKPVRPGPVGPIGPLALKHVGQVFLAEIEIA